MATWKVRRVLVEVQECTVKADSEFDACVIGKNLAAVSNLISRHATVFEVQEVEDGPTDPDMRT